MFQNLVNREHMSRRYKCIRCKLNSKSFDPLDHINIQKHGVTNIIHEHGKMNLFIIRYTLNVIKGNKNVKNLPTNKSFL